MGEQGPAKRPDGGRKYYSSDPHELLVIIAILAIIVAVVLPFVRWVLDWLGR